MNARPSGWYDDPENDELLRYWDGVVWTEHTAFKRPQRRAGAGDEQAQHASEPAVQPAGRYGATGTPPPWAAPGSGGLAGSRTASGAWQGTGRIAPDGSPYASWFARVIAYVLDLFIAGLLALPFAWPVLSPVVPTVTAWWTELASASMAGTALPALPEPALVAIGRASLIEFIITLAYEVFLLGRFGATLGMRILGLRVRAVGGSGPAPWMAVIRRTAIKYVSDFFSGIALLSLAASLFTLVNYCWPIADPARQALHDKAARTEVIRTRPR